MRHLGNPEPKKEKSFEEQFEEEVWFTRGWGSEVEKRLQEGKKVAQKRLKQEEGLDIEIEELYTAAELWDYIYDSLKDQGVPETIIDYVNIAEMARDDNYSGYLDYIDVNIPEAVSKIRYFYFTR